MVVGVVGGLFGVLVLGGGGGHGWVYILVLELAVVAKEHGLLFLGDFFWRVSE